MKRKTAICKCGRTVESKTVYQMGWHNQQETYGRCVVYTVGCECGIKTEMCWLSPIGAWAEWDRLQEAKP